MEYRELVAELHKYPAVYLYGAGVVAYGAYQAIKGLFDIAIRGFLVTDTSGQPAGADGVPVLGVDEAEVNKQGSLVIIATPEEYHGSISDGLAAREYLHYIRLDSHTEYVLMGAYLKKAVGLKLAEDMRTTGTCADIRDTGVYMAVSHRDKELAGTYTEKPWVKRIQVGAALTEERIAPLTDIGEESLSLENALYGELTASYYAWKYGKEAVTGLFHYRRTLEVTEEQLGLLHSGELDVILPLPFVCRPDASGQYGRYLAKEDIDIMLEVLRERERTAACISSASRRGDGFAEIEAILGTPYLYNYNILIATRECFENYCGWLFPLLGEIKERCEKAPRSRLPRYIGRVGEVLTSIYFMRNTRGFKIAHAQKVWRV